ncbi:hypothetical protein HPB50_010458 [Hyalomma asiaticum]|uniref:Uncharacterized protein n=1 Tax=Hyalomma asiaticum TaxID=266040 RepID=A0ACB7RPA2_HYAAI|nr:hypothetical protein HPB50_010458 [Hyalomma asiaticum]
MSQARFALSDFEDPELPPWSPDFYDDDGLGPASELTTWWPREMNKRWQRKLSVLTVTPEDRSYLKSTAGSSSTRARKPGKSYWTHAGSSSANQRVRNRRLSFSPGALASEAGTPDENVTIPVASSAPRRQQQSPRMRYVGKGSEVRAGFPRQARRRSTYDLTGEDTEATVDQIRTPATTTDVKYTSHRRATRQLRQFDTKATGRPRRSPPRKIIVFSKPRSSSLSPLPRIDDFTDIPPAQVILFDSPTHLMSSRLNKVGKSGGRTTSTPRKIKMTSDNPSRQKSPLSDSWRPVTQVSAMVSVPEETDERRTTPAVDPAAGTVTYDQVWVFCVVVCATLLLPLAMVTLSYLLTPMVHARHTTAGSKSAVTRRTPTSFTLPTWPRGVTVNPWHHMPTACRRQRVVSDDISSVVSRSSIRGAPSESYDLFCLYNVSRFFRSLSDSFLPVNMPFAVCRYIVYWSFRLVDGDLVSRTPKFDNAYGLAKLKEILSDAGASNVEVLLAVGGYVEESPQFSLLGRDANAMARFVTSAMRLLMSDSIDGLALHWLEAEPSCRSTGNVAENVMLRACFVDLRRIFDLNSFRGTLAVILSAEVDDTVIDTVIDVVDYVILETHRLAPGLPLDYDICESVARRMLDTVVSRNSFYGNEHKLCISLSVAPWKIETQPAIYGHPPNLTALSSSGNPPGFGSATEMCSSTTCLLGHALSGTCVPLRVTMASRSVYIFLFMNETVLQNLFREGMVAGKQERCALLVDLDLDSYSGQCNRTGNTASQSTVSVSDYYLVQEVNERWQRKQRLDSDAGGQKLSENWLFSPHPKTWDVVLDAYRKLELQSESTQPPPQLWSGCSRQRSGNTQRERPNTSISWCTTSATTEPKVANQQEALSEPGVTVYPKLFESRDKESEKVLVIHDGYSLNLNKGSVLADTVLLRDLTESGVVETYVGFLNFTHIIEPYDIMERSPEGVIAHKISLIATNAGINAAIEVAAKISLPSKFILEVALIADYYHTTVFGEDTVERIQYTQTLMLAVSLRMQQLNPPGFISLIMMEGSYVVSKLTGFCTCFYTMINIAAR